MVAPGEPTTFLLPVQFLTQQTWKAEHRKGCVSTNSWFLLPWSASGSFLNRSRNPFGTAVSSYPATFEGWVGWQRGWGRWKQWGDECARMHTQRVRDGAAEIFGHRSKCQACFGQTSAHLRTRTQDGIMPLSFKQLRSAGPGSNLNPLPAVQQSTALPFLLHIGCHSFLWGQHWVGMKPAVHSPWWLARSILSSPWDGGATPLL